MLRTLMISCLIIAGLTTACSQIREFAKDNPEAVNASITASCEIGKVAIASVFIVTPLTYLVAESLCEQFRNGVFPASSVDFGSKKLNINYAIRDVVYDDPAYEAELQRIRQGLLSS